MKSRRFDPHVNRNSQGKKSIFPRLHEDDFWPSKNMKITLQGMTISAGPNYKILFIPKMWKNSLWSANYISSLGVICKENSIFSATGKRQNHLLWSPKWLHFSSLFPHCLLSEEVDKKWIHSGVELWKMKLNLTAILEMTKKVMTKTYEAHKRKLCVINFQLHVLRGNMVIKWKMINCTKLGTFDLRK